MRSFKRTRIFGIETIIITQSKFNVSKFESKFWKTSEKATEIVAKGIERKLVVITQFMK